MLNVLAEDRHFIFVTGITAISICYSFGPSAIQHTFCLRLVYLIVLVHQQYNVLSAISISYSFGPSAVQRFVCDWYIL